VLDTSILKTDKQGSIVGANSNDLIIELECLLSFKRTRVPPFKSPISQSNKEVLIE